MTAAHTRGIGLVLWAAWSIAASPTFARGTPLTVVILPFEGKGTGGPNTTESIELELELVENIRLQASRNLRRDLTHTETDPFTPANLRRIMRQRKVDVLVRGERAQGEGGFDDLVIWAYASDGKLRWTRKRPLPTSPEVEAKQIAAELVEALEQWSELSPNGSSNSTLVFGNSTKTTVRPWAGSAWGAETRAPSVSR